MYGVPSSVVHSRINFKLLRSAPILKQQLRPPLPQLNRKQGRGRSVRRARERGKRPRVEEKGVRAASENTEGNRGREAVHERTNPRPSRPGERASENLAAGALRPPGTDTPALPGKKEM